MQASTQTAQALAACAKNIKLFWFHASSLRKRANNALYCQNVCANTLFAQIACTCRGRLKMYHLYSYAAPTRASNLRKQSVCANCLTVYGVVCVLAQAACVKSKQIDIFCASSQCLRRLSACLHKHTSVLPVVLLGVDTVWLCQLLLIVVLLTTLCFQRDCRRTTVFNLIYRRI